IVVHRDDFYLARPDSQVAADRPREAFKKRQCQDVQGSSGRKWLDFEPSTGERAVIPEGELSHFVPGERVCQPVAFTTRKPSRIERDRVRMRSGFTRHAKPGDVFEELQPSRIDVGEQIGVALERVGKGVLWTRIGNDRDDLDVRGPRLAPLEPDM